MTASAETVPSTPEEERALFERFVAWRKFQPTNQGN